MIAFRLDCEVGGARAGDVHVAIWARRRMVSSGNLMLRSKADARNVKIDQEVGLMAGSRLRFDFRKRGVDVAMKVGIVDVRNVIGMRWVGVI